MNALPTELSRLVRLEPLSATLNARLETASTNPQALAVAKERKPDVFLMRIRDGYSVRWSERLSLAKGEGYVVRHDPGVTNLRWIYHLLVVNQAKLGGPQRDTHLPNLDAVSCLVPPLTEQARVVALLDEAERLVALRRRADSKAARLLPATFAHMIGDPERNPKQWPVRFGIDIFERIWEGSGSDISPSAVLGQPSDIKKRLRLVAVGAKAPDEGGPVSLERGDLLLSISDQVTSTCSVVHNTFATYRTGRYLVCRPTAGINPAWFSDVWGHPAVQRQVGVMRMPDAKFEVIKTAIESLRVPVPPREVQDTFAAKAVALSSLERLQTKAARALTHIAEELAYQSFSGRLTQKWRESRKSEWLAERAQQALALNQSDIGTRSMAQ